MEIYLFLGIVAFCAGFVQGLSGFGSVLLSLPLLALFLGCEDRHSGSGTLLEWR